MSKLSIFEMIQADLEARNQKGLETYGKTLYAHDGRDSLWDLYEELLDAVVYCRKIIAERDGLHTLSPQKIRYFDCKQSDSHDDHFDIDGRYCPGRKFDKT